MEIDRQMDLLNSHWIKFYPERAMSDRINVIKLILKFASVDIIPQFGTR